MHKILGLVVLFMAFVCIPGCTSQSSLQQKYLESRNDLTTETRNAIIEGKIIKGMYPDEAAAAGGAFMYMLQPDPKLGLGENVMVSVADLNYYFAFLKNPNKKPDIPPDVIFRQCIFPDESKIRLVFHNKTQFNSIKPVSFSVYITNGQVFDIRETPD